MYHPSFEYKHHDLHYHIMLCTYNISLLLIKSWNTDILHHYLKSALVIAPLLHLEELFNPSYGSAQSILGGSSFSFSKEKTYNTSFPPLLALKL